MHCSFEDFHYINLCIYSLGPQIANLRDYLEPTVAANLNLMPTLNMANASNVLASVLIGDSYLKQL